ncbi:DUF4334 domain-containing protein [Kineosporia sp. J2-2]|uniref:DUF4334 domain-containing protein n=1 Tax=Kineosporia corallincola TaxID=2835133 RepID=A0ABS5TPV0_9ACTN|nr:DUF4334 domain-containing protein [Kineosporia corallincola]MBT0771624.1 DUF4334 domain-containing protein [Kineosporia corallincola]
MTDEASSTLERWLRDGTTAREGLALFDALPPVSLAQMIGDWRGCELRTGHPLDGILEAAGWQGKHFHDPETVDPLVFAHRAGQFRVNPALLPLGLAARHPGLMRNPLLRRLSFAALPLMRTGRPRARLRMIEYRGVLSGAMQYDALPVNDHFRRVGPDTLLGVMDLRGVDPPYLFALHRRVAGGRND